jgi:hypothetical protein
MESKDCSTLLISSHVEIQGDKYADITVKSICELGIPKEDRLIYE